MSAIHMSTQAIEPAKGRFQPGNTYGAGRPKTAKTITDALRKAVESGAGDKIAKNMINLALNAKQSAVQVKASEFIADRLEGRPMQAIAMMQVMDENTAKHLIRIAELFMKSQSETGALTSLNCLALSAQPGQKSE